MHALTLGGTDLPPCTGFSQEFSENSSLGHPCVTGAMATANPECPLEFLIKRYKFSLAHEAKKRGKRVAIIGDYSKWEREVYDEVDTWDEDDIGLTKDPFKKARLMQRLTDLLQSVPYVFISENAYSHMFKLAEAMNMVGLLDGGNSQPWMLCSQYQQIIDAELQFSADRLKEGKYRLAADSLIASVLALNIRGFEDGWTFAENHPEPQDILNRMGDLWRKIMNSEELKNLRMNEEKQYLLPAGFLRESAKDLDLEIPAAIRGEIERWTVEKVLDDRARSVLYDEIQKMDAEIQGIGYDDGIPFGKKPSDLKDLKHEIIDIMDVGTYTKVREQSRKENLNQRTEEKLENQTAEELREMIWNQNEEHCAIDVDESDREQLIGYIINKKAVILEMKRKHHYEVVCKQQRNGWFHTSMSERDINIHFVRRDMFDERRYAVRGGIVVQRDMYQLEIEGRESDPEALEIVWTIEEAIAEEKRERNERKRKLEELKGWREATKAAKRRKTCTVSCAYDTAELRAARRSQGPKKDDLSAECKRHLIPYSGSKKTVALRLLVHYRDFHAVEED